MDKRQLWIDKCVHDEQSNSVHNLKENMHIKGARKFFIYL